VYHRSYEGVAEPIKVYLYSDRLEIISYPGPVPGIEQAHLDGREPIPPVPARNRRVGEFLKELRLAEGRGTGIPKVRRVMTQNGSEPPRFDFDADRGYFRVTLPAHPEYQAILAIQDVANLRAVGDTNGAVRRLQEAHTRHPSAVAIAIELAKDLLSRGDIHAAEEVYATVKRANPTANLAAIITQIAAAYLDDNRQKDATVWLDRLPMLDAVEDAFEAAIQEKRAGRLEKAHSYFRAAGNAVDSDAKALHEFAQVKMKLAEKVHPSGRSGNKGAYQQQLKEAEEMLRRVVQMDAPRTRRAWAWFDLGRVLKWSRAPRHEIRAAFEKAIEIDPNENRFTDALAKLVGDGRAG